jgi:mRNA-degrading endonuclease HigB of HigAB toxin-antitoxin module
MIIAEDEAKKKIDFLLLSADVLKDNPNLLKFYTGVHDTYNNYVNFDIQSNQYRLVQYEFSFHIGIPEWIIFQ